MALIKCPECGKEMSSTALACPCCGAPNKAEQAKEETKKSNQLTSTICGAIMLCIALFGENFGITGSQKLICMLGLGGVVVAIAVANSKAK